jgi:hypothetical protein
MTKPKSMLLSVAMILTLGLFFAPTSIRAEDGGPQNTSNSQSSGGSSLTLADLIRITILVLR